MKINENIAFALRSFRRLAIGKYAFCNIAEGTHAGSVTMKASEPIDSQNLLVTAGEIEGEFSVASASKKPIGVCLDEGSAGDIMSVALPGCAESTFVCKTAASVSAGDSLYTSAGGSAKSVSAAASESGITFTLDANGTASETKIAWMILRKN